MYGIQVVPATKYFSNDWLVEGGGGMGDEDGNRICISKYVMLISGVRSFWLILTVLQRAGVNFSIAIAL